MGFSNWKNALRGFRLHESSRFHSDCVYAVQQRSKLSVVAQIDTAAKKQQEQRRRLFMAEVSSLKYLLRQGIALRRNKEEEGNLFQLMKLRCNDIPGLDEWLNERKYFSHDIINELAKEMAHVILRSVSAEVKLRICCLSTKILLVLM
jgi:hypothetical protein